MIENITEIESGLGLKEGTLKDAIASEEAVKVEMPKGQFVDPETHKIFTNEDFDARVANIKAEAGNAAVEIAVKTARKDHELEFEGKTMENLVKALQEKALADAKVEPDAKIGELSRDKEALQKKIEELQGSLDNMAEETKRKDNQRQVDSSILSAIPDGLTLSKEQIMTLFKAEYEAVSEDGKVIVKKGGETLKNETSLDPLPLSDVITKFAEGFAKSPEGGKGGADTKESKAGSMDAFIKEMEDAGNPVGSEKFNLEMNKRISDKTLTV